jgi:hypothetical protein
VTDVEELLREGIDRVAAGTDAPTHLLRRARQHNRRRRQAIAGALAAGTAAVTAAAVIAASTGSPQTSSLHSQTITYVSTRTEQALAQLNQERAIEYSSETVRGSDFGFTVLNLANKPGSGSPTVPGVLTNVHAVRQTAWTYQGLRLWQGYSTAGTLVYSYAETATEAYGAAYPDRTQWHTPISTVNPADIPATCQNAGFGYPTWAKSIAKALSCHVFKLGGNQKVNGIEAVKLIRKFSGGYTMTLWVDPAGYLPVRIAYGYPGTHGAAITETVELHWLAPVQGNLARLHAAQRRGVIPSGFRELPPSDFPEATVDLPGSPG